MAALSNMQHRHGMVYLEDTSSGEFEAGLPPGPITPSDVLVSVTAPPHFRTASGSSSKGAGSEGSYEEIYSSSSDDECDSYHSEGDDFAEYWDPYLYQLQQRAPQPNCIPCLKRVQSQGRPDFYGPEYHSSISRDETSRLLGNKDGNYLVRKGLSHSGTYSLSFVFDGQVRHYKLYYEDGYHYVGEKPFDTIEDLVQDGLITLYMEANNVEEYLQSARETRLEHTSVAEDRKEDPAVSVFGNGGTDLSSELEGMSMVQTRARKPVYHPCTIPHRRDCTNIQISSEHEGEGGDEGEDVEEQNLSPTTSTSNIEPPLDEKERKPSTLGYNYEKAHNFKLHNYIGMMAWCDYCRNFMWGLRNQGFKCKDCGYNVHKQCKEETRLDCQPSRQLIKRVYGVELTTLVKMEGSKIPSVVKDCIEEVENRGLDVEGLYRLSGKKNDILRLKAKFDTDMRADLSKFEDIHALTGAMKLYLRELPIPLITFVVYDLFLIAVRMGSTEESMQMLQIALQRLPPPHYNTLRHIIRHLHQVQLLKDENRMDSKNLAVVFTPSLMRSSQPLPSIMAVQKLPEEKTAIDMLIQHYHTLFT